MGVEGPEDFPEPPRLRQLRWLVNALTATLIVGVIAIVTLLVIRLGPMPQSSPPLPPSVRLPAGESARAVTFGSGWMAVVTVDAGGKERIRVLDARTGDERAVTEIAPAP
ncbi:MAG: DUF6476 family protein [Amaricoccus sp.]